MAKLFVCCLSLLASKIFSAVAKIPFQATDVGEERPFEYFTNFPLCVFSSSASRKYDLRQEDFLNEIVLELASQKNIIQDHDDEWYIPTLTFSEPMTCVNFPKCHGLTFPIQNGMLYYKI